MKLGFSTNVFNNPENIVATIDQISASYQFVEVELENDIRKLFDRDYDAWTRIRDDLVRLKDTRSIAYSFHAPYIGKKTDISNKDPEIRQNAAAYLSRFAEEASYLGAEVMTVHPGYLYERGQTSDLSEIFENLRQSLGTLSDAARKMNVKILLENTGDDRPMYVVLTPEQHERLCSEFGVGLTMDLVHYHTYHYEDDDAVYFDELKGIVDLIEHCHVNDLANGKHSHLPFGEGNFNFHRAITFMLDRGFDGRFIIEENGPDHKPKDYIDAGLRYQRSVLRNDKRQALAA